MKKQYVILLMFLVTLWGGDALSGSLRPTVESKELAGEIFHRVNRERELFNLPPLANDKELEQVAVEHSTDMGKKGYVNHVNKVGEGPEERARRKGYSCRKEYEGYYTEGIGENIYQNNLYDSFSVKRMNGRVVERTYHWNSLEEIARLTVEGWMASPPHRKNILNPLFDRQGIGVYISPDNKVYVTQDFC